MIADLPPYTGVKTEDNGYIFTYIGTTVLHPPTTKHYYCFVSDQKIRISYKDWSFASKDTHVEETMRTQHLIDNAVINGFITSKDAQYIIWLTTDELQQIRFNYLVADYSLNEIVNQLQLSLSENQQITDFVINLVA